MCVYLNGIYNFWFAYRIILDQQRRMLLFEVVGTDVIVQMRVAKYPVTFAGVGYLQDCKAVVWKLFVACMATFFGFVGPCFFLSFSF